MSFFICLIRLGYRIVRMEKVKIIRHNSPAENVMIIGRDSNAKKVMEYLEGNNERNLRPVCILDAQGTEGGRYMNGIPVVSGTEKLNTASKNTG